jgi:hypothetical protein
MPRPYEKFTLDDPTYFIDPKSKPEPTLIIILDRSQLIAKMLALCSWYTNKSM